MLKSANLSFEQAAAVPEIGDESHAGIAQQGKPSFGAKGDD